MEKYSIIEEIGEGTYGIVYKAKDRFTGKEVALKKIKVEDESEGVPAPVLRQISVLRALNHPNVVSLLGVFFDNNRIFLVLEFLQMDLKCLMDIVKGPLPLDLVKSYLRQVMDGIAYCHERCVLHNGLKPQNLLVDQQGRIKLADLGLVTAFYFPVRDYTRAHELVTLWYRAPETLFGDKFYSTAADVWSLACIYAEMASGHPLFPGESEQGQLLRIFQALGTPGTDDVWPEAYAYCASFPRWPACKARALLPAAVLANPDAASLFEAMLRYGPSERVDARDALDHPYFRDASLVLPALPAHSDESDDSL